MSVRKSRAARFSVLLSCLLGATLVYILDPVSGSSDGDQGIHVVSTAYGDGSVSEHPTLTLGKPAQVNDLLLVGIYAPVGAPVPPPDGYTLVAEVDGNANGDPHLIVWSRVAVGGETGLSYEVPNWFRTANAGVMLVYRGVDPQDPIEARSSTTKSWTLSSEAPAIASTSSKSRLVLFTQTRGAALAHQYSGPTTRVTASCCPAMSVADQEGTPGQYGPTRVSYAQPSKVAHITLSLRAPGESRSSVVGLDAAAVPSTIATTNVTTANSSASETPIKVATVTAAPVTAAPPPTAAPVTAAPVTAAPVTAAPPPSAPPTTSGSVSSSGFGAKPTDSSTGPRVPLSIMRSGELSGQFRGVRIVGDVRSSGPLTLTDCWIDGNIIIYDNPIVLDHCYVNGYVGVVTENTDPGRSMFTARFTRFVGPADNDVMHLGARVWGDNSKYINSVIEDSIIHSSYLPTPNAHADVLQFGGGRNSVFRRVILSLRSQDFDSSLTSYVNNGTQNSGVSFESVWVEGGPMGYTLGGPMTVTNCILNQSVAYYGYLYPDFDGNVANDPKLVNCFDDRGRRL